MGAAPADSVSKEFRPRYRWWILPAYASLGVLLTSPWGWWPWPWSVPVGLALLVLAVRCIRMGVTFETDSVIWRQVHKTRTFRRSEIASFSAGQALNAFSRPLRVLRLEPHLGETVKIGDIASMFDDALVNEVVAYGNAWLDSPAQR